MGVFRCVFDRTMSKKSAAVGTGAMALRPLVDMVKPACGCRVRAEVECLAKKYEFPRSPASTIVSKNESKKKRFRALGQLHRQSKPGARDKGSTRRRGPGPLPPPRDAPFPIHHYHYPGGRSWLDGRTGRATLWAACGPIKPHKKSKSAHAMNRRKEKSNDIRASPPRQPPARPA